MAIKTFTFPPVAINTTGLATSANQATEIANQATQITSLNSIDTKTPALVGGRQPVDGSGVTQPISAVALPLPAGAATETTLAAVNTKLTTTANGLKVDGSAVTQPVSGTVSVSNFPASQAVTGTVAVSSLPSIPAGANAIGSVSVSNFPASQTVSVSNFPASQAVTGTFFQTTQPISAASLPLPAGAATETTLSALNTKVTTTVNGIKTDGSATTQPISAASLPLPTGAATAANQATANTTLSSIDTKTPNLGQNLMVTSSPVVIASNQTAIPISLPDGSSQTVTGNFTSAGQFIQVNTNGASIAAFRTTGTWAGLIAIYASVDGSNYDLLPVYDYVGQTSQSFSGGNTTFAANIGGFKTIRLQAVTLTSGTAAAALWLNPGQGPQICLSPMAAGFYTTANLRAGDATPITQTSGALDVNIKTPTSLSTKSSGKTAVALARNDYATTSVTTAAYVQLIATVGATAVSEIEIFDSSGQTLFLAVGAAASEVNQIYILPGGNGRVPLSIAAGSRVSVKAVSASATSGECTINFYG